MAEPRDEDIAATPDEKIYNEAYSRFQHCEEWENTARARYIADVRFGVGDSDNQYQWPDQIRNQRTIDQKPCLTINKTRQHCLMIINDARQNKAGVVVHPVGFGASYEAAQLWEAVIRAIERNSNAQSAYDCASWHQVFGGIGYWRIVTDYLHDDTLDQEIYIRRVPNPMNIYIDPDCDEFDKSDMRFAFVYEDVPRDEWNDRFPKYKDIIDQAPLDESGGWNDKNHVRIAEYFRVVTETDTLYRTPDGQVVRKSDLDSDVLQEMQDMHGEDLKSRDIEKRRVEWFKIAASKIVERGEWPGKYIPIVPVIGEETIIEGEMDRRGHVRSLKDPQRIYNYWSSNAVEAVALQPKSPYIAPAEAIEGYETYWKSANKVAHSILPYKNYTDAGQKLDPPFRVEPAQMGPAFIEGMKVAAEELMMASGQYQAQMGAPSNERSGKAIEERQRQGDNATYHYIDHHAQAIRHTGRILIDLIPKVYDTRRIIRILDEAGEESHIQVEPNAPEAYRAMQGAGGPSNSGPQQNSAAPDVRAVFNPNIGRYSVEAEPGPSYSTARQQAFEAIEHIIGAAPELMQVVGDLMFQAADFPLADKIAERLRNMVPPQALGQGPSPQDQALTKQLQEAQQLVQKLSAENQTLKSKTQARDVQKDVDIYKAENDRLKTIFGAMHPEQQAHVAAQLMMQLKKDGAPQPILPPQMPMPAQGTGGQPT